MRRRLSGTPFIALVVLLAACSEDETSVSLDLGAGDLQGLGAPLKAGAATEATADLDTKGKVSSKGTRSYEVTKAVQAWADGSLNNGWAILPNGSNMWYFRSSEWGSIAERPMLTVVY